MVVEATEPLPGRSRRRNCGLVIIQQLRSILRATLPLSFNGAPPPPAKLPPLASKDSPAFFDPTS